MSGRPLPILARTMLRSSLSALGGRFRRILREELIAIRTQEIATCLGLDGRKVLAGPFAGMHLWTERSWPSRGGTPLPMVLGTYEAELHLAIEQAVTREYEVIVDIGCAEGYYAIGFGLRLPQAHIFAFDIDPAARRICTMTARLNGIADRVTIGGEITRDGLAAVLADKARVLLFVDCEGCEDQLLEPTLVPGLTSCDLIVELHDFAYPGVTERIVERFRATHEVQLVYEAGRDPADHPMLMKLSGFDRLLAVCEYRPETMRYAVMRRLG